MSARLNGNEDFVSAETEKDIEILNGALGGEYFGISAYDAAIGTGFLNDGVRDVAKKFQGDHQKHARKIRELIIELGGEPVESKTWEDYAAEYPPPPLTDQVDILRYAASLERSGASATVISIGELRTPAAVMLAASIAGVEAMHWSALLGALGEDPVPVSFISTATE